jgi:hypothetical protein
VQLLRVPSALLDTLPGGPVRHDAEWMARLLCDPVRTAVALVTLPEELPVNEAIELDAEVGGVLGMARGALFVNAMPASRSRPEEARALAALAAEPSPLGPAARAAQLALLRAEGALRQLERARAAIDVPTTVLPLLPAASWGLPEIEEVAEAMAASWTEGDAA